MRAFFELKKNKILHTVFKTYKSYNVALLTASTKLAASESLFLYGSGSQVRGRSFFNSNFEYLTSSAEFSGSIYFGAYDSNYSGLLLSSTVGRRAAQRLNNIYASSTFIKPQNYDSLNVLNADVEIEIPAVFYGSEIKPGSFSLVVTGTGGAGVGGYRYTDDGYGGIYSGTTRVGAVYYQHGIVIFEGLDPTTPNGGTLIGATIGFSGTYETPMNMYILDVPKGEGNFSTNSSYVNYNTGTFDYKLAINTPKTYITAVGLYDENYDLVGIVKLATPLLHDEIVSGQIRAKLVF